MRAILVLAPALAWAAAAGANPGGSHVGFVSTFSAVEPPVPGLLVQVLGGHERLSVRNLTRSTVVVHDAKDRPLVELAPGASRAWREPRIGASGPPPGGEALVRRWPIPGIAGGRRFAIVGFLGYRPPAAKDPGFPAWGIVLAAAGGGLVLAAALALPLRKRKGEG